MTKLNEILSEVLRVDEDKIVDDLAIHKIQTWNSLTHIELVISIEEAFKLQFTEDEIVAMRSIGEIRNVLRARGALAE